MTEQPYTLTELMAVIAAREIKDGEVVFAGTGLPMLGVTPMLKIAVSFLRLGQPPASLPTSPCQSVTHGHCVVQPWQ
jgi:glutaconate CoA-transferase subunit B